MQNIIYNKDSYTVCRLKALESLCSHVDVMPTLNKTYLILSYPFGWTSNLYNMYMYLEDMICLGKNLNSIMEYTKYNNNHIAYLFQKEWNYDYRLHASCHQENGLGQISQALEMFVGRCLLNPNT